MNEHINELNEGLGDMYVVLLIGAFTILYHLGRLIRRIYKSRKS